MGKLSEWNAKYIPDVHPTGMPDGTTLNGVIYDCGGYDLLFYTDTLRALVGSSADGWVSSQPYGVDVAHGHERVDIPALGSAKRPEAARLAKLLQDPIVQVSNAQQARYEERGHQGKRGVVRPLLWRLDRIAEILLFHPGIVGVPKITIASVDGVNFTGYTVEHNDWGYVEKLVDATLPGRWRTIDRKEQRQIDQNRKKLLREQRRS